MICGNCGAATQTAATVKECFAGRRVPCGWQVPDFVTVGDDGETWPVIRECGAHVTFTDDGWTCENGHSYVSMEARFAQGWDYAEGDDEATALMKVGVDPVAIDGRSFQWGASR